MSDIPDIFKAGMVFQLDDARTVVVTKLWGRGRNRGVTFKHADSGTVTNASARAFRSALVKDSAQLVHGCRECGCTDDNCEGCIARTGGPCHWVEHDLCSACPAADTEAQ